MSLMATGLILFTVAHLYLAIAPGGAAGLRRTLGPLGTKAAVSLLSLGGIVLMVLGWKSAPVNYLYQPPPGLRLPAMAVTAFAVYLLVVANRPSAVKRVLRHPQLTGIALWSLAHLAMNGDNRSLLLFGGLAVWAVVEIILINRRDGAWERPAAPTRSTDAVTLLLGGVLCLALIYAHPWLAGVAILVR